MFRDRADAGQQLADVLEERGIEADLVLAIPRGALPVARPVADRLGAPLDVVVARKIGAPTNPELALGAVADDGTAWLNDDLIERLGVADDYLRQTRAGERANAKEKFDRYRGERGPLDVTGKRVVVVDDGVATGATMRACLLRVRAGDPARVVAAVPVGPPDTLADLRSVADEVIAVETPENFRAVGRHYERFDQVTDEQARTYLS
ncbi:MAG: phosphoribosyltransferase [Haloarculaceae archaeon]